MNRAWRQPSRTVLHLALAILLLTLSARVTPAQSGRPDPAAPGQVTVDPIQCWWRTSTPAVRVGEPFGVVLTCSLVETESIRILLDETKLGPEAIPLAPFEVLDGSRAADRRTSDHRFFQREYHLRLVNDTLFGKDVPVPALSLAYRVQSPGSDGTALTGIEKKYELPAQTIRILSLVSQDVTDIRDASAGTFANLDRAEFQASTLIAGGRVLVAVGGLLAVLALVSAVGGRTRVDRRTTLLSASAVLNQAARELARVRRERTEGGWTHDLAARALAALRLVGAYAMAHDASQREAADEATGGDGAFVHTALSGKRVLLSSALTAGRVRQARDLASAANAPASRVGTLEALASLDDALSTLTGAQYGRPTALDETSLDAVLASAESLVRHTKRRYRWPARTAARLSARLSTLGRRVWHR